MRTLERTAPRVAGLRPAAAPRRFRRAGVVSSCLALVFLVASLGCSANGDIDSTTAPVLLVVHTISPTSTPFGDVMTSSGTILEDTVLVQMVARLKNSSDTTAPVLQEIIVDRYEVTFTRTDGGAATPAGFTRAVNQKVRITEHSRATERITEFSIVLVPATMKAQPPISYLISPGLEPGTGFINIQTTATIRFYGKSLAGDPVSATAQIGVDFANFADAS